MWSAVVATEESGLTPASHHLHQVQMMRRMMSKKKKEQAKKMSRSILMDYKARQRDSGDLRSQGNHTSPPVASGVDVNNKGSCPSLNRDEHILSELREIKTLPHQLQKQMDSIERNSANKGFSSDQSPCSEAEQEPSEVSSVTSQVGSQRKIPKKWLEIQEYMRVKSGLGRAEVKKLIAQKCADECKMSRRKSEELPQVSRWSLKLFFG
ncbi:hypothetical protein GJAV_G00089710 [Gymnothorax javanicus]|nr:hypothetical protein GJAV_G00089710 [Gymnothorax javanicus]